MKKRALSLALCLMIVLGLVLPLTARAQEPERKLVRVGWYESTYCYRDQYGQRHRHRLRDGKTRGRRERRAGV